MEKISSGIVGLLELDRTTGKALSEFAETLMRGPGPIEQMDREIIATFVSARNGCHFCSRSHGAIAVAMGISQKIVDALWRGEIPKQLPSDVACLLKFADRVRQNWLIPEGLYNQAANNGVTDKQIRSAVLIASAFSMFNRYVETLSVAPTDPKYYQAIGERISKEGYLA